MIVIFTKTKRVVAVGDENTNADELLKQCQEKYPDIGCWAYATTQANYEDTIQMAVRPIMLKEEIDHMRHQNKAEQLDMNALQALISLTATLATTQYIYESHFLFEGTDLPEDDKRDYNNWWNVKMSLIGMFTRQEFMDNWQEIHEEAMRWGVHMARLSDMEGDKVNTTPDMVDFARPPSADRPSSVHVEPVNENQPIDKPFPTE